MLLKNKNVQMPYHDNVTHTAFSIKELRIEQIDQRTTELSESSIRSSANSKELLLKYKLKSSACNSLMILR